MEYIQLRSRALVLKGISTNTQLAYNTAVNTFSTFRRLYNLPTTWPIPLQHVIWFITYLFEKSYSSKTIHTYVSGLSFYHKINCWYNITEVFLVRKLLEGCRRNRPSVDNRAPITISMLIDFCKILPNVTYSEFETSLFRAIFTTAYFGLFRVSELVFSVVDNRSILFKDIKLEANYVMITIRISKNNQYGKPVTLKIPCESNTLICPVCNIKQYISIRPAAAGQFFVHANLNPVTRYQFSAVLKKCLKQSSFKLDTYTSHSFRIGRATQLAIMGLSEIDIMKLGRWKSIAYLSYIRTTTLSN